MILLIDNYDSFVHNVARYFERLGHTTLVVRNDAIDADEVAQLRPDAIVLSPGPCTPREAGRSLVLVEQLHARFPMLGICLGHQAIAVALGGRLMPAREPVHGRASLVFHDNEGIFEKIANPTPGGRYHSLVVDAATLPSCLRANAWTAAGELMAVAHRELPVVGVQFHPESILTEAGYPLLANFLRIAGLALPAALPDIADERATEPFPAATDFARIPC